MAPKVPDSYLQARRDQIVDAACACFVEKGLDRTTMPDIFKAAELSPGAVYNYFSSKEDIIEACAAKSLENDNRLISAAVASEGDNPIMGLLHTFFPILKTPGIEKTLGFDLDLYAESTRNPRIAAILKVNYDALLGRFMELVKQMQQESRLNKELDTRALAQFFIASYFGMLITRVLEPGIDIDNVITVYESILSDNLITE